MFFPSSPSLWRPGNNILYNTNLNFNFSSISESLILPFPGSSRALLRKRSRLWEEPASWLLSDCHQKPMMFLNKSENFERFLFQFMGHSCFRQDGENWPPVESIFGELHRVDSWRRRLQVDHGEGKWNLVFVSWKHNNGGLWMMIVLVSWTCMNGKRSHWF